MGTRLVDPCGRTLDYLRISVTDRCNFRCRYCLPLEGIPLLPRDHLLSGAEITRVARLFLEMGGRKIKLTGGEPLTRPDIVALVGGIAALPGLGDLGLTTNGFYLAELADPLRRAGLQRVNVSLDSMNRNRFAAMTRSPSWDRVMAGIDAALASALAVKINVVVMRGITDAELRRFGALVQQQPVEVRFIEFMPLCGTGWHPEWMVPLATVEDFFRAHYALTPITRGSATAKSYRLRDGRGAVGFIASMTEPFCDRCSRLRLTADGTLRPCLFSNAVVELRAALRGGASDVGITDLIAEAVQSKPAGHGIAPSIASAENLPRIRAFGG